MTLLPMRRWWVSWFHDEKHGGFYLRSPWWVSGEDGDGRQIICAALAADSESHAKIFVQMSYDDPYRAESLEWRFVEQRPDDWSPFCDRFPRAEWMLWPEGDDRRRGVTT